MNTEGLGNSRILNLLFKPAGMMMESKLRRRLMNPIKTLKGAGFLLAEGFAEPPLPAPGTASSNPFP